MSKKIIIAICVAVVVISIDAIIFIKVDKNNLTNNQNEQNVNNLEGETTDLESNEISDEITIKVLEDTITRESIEILITDKRESNPGWDTEFKVQQKINGEWQDLKYKDDRIESDLIGMFVDDNKQLTQKLDIEKYYGKLQNGIYRIGKDIYNNADGNYIYIYSNEFEIK